MNEPTVWHEKVLEQLCATSLSRFQLIPPAALLWGLWEQIPVTVESQQEDRLQVCFFFDRKAK